MKQKQRKTNSEQRRFRMRKRDELRRKIALKECIRNEETTWQFRVFCSFLPQNSNSVNKPKMRRNYRTPRAPRSILSSQVHRQQTCVTPRQHQHQHQQPLPISTTCCASLPSASSSKQGIQLSMYEDGNSCPSL